MGDKRTPHKKAASLIFEAVLIFGISVAIFIASYFVFSSYQLYFTSVGMNDQLYEVKDFIAANIVKLAEKDDSTNSSITLKIPRTIANEHYEIILSSGGLTVSTSTISKTSNLYYLNQSFQFSGSAASNTGRITIYKNGKQIII